MAKVYFSRQTVLSGMVIRSTVDSGIIDTIKMPPLGGRFLTVEARDIRGDNRVRIAGDSIPLLSSNQISYKGQPIIALFGPDIESVVLKSQEADISYRLADSTATENTHAPITRDFGDFESIINQSGIKAYSQNYDFARLSSPNWNITRISVGMAEGVLHVIAPTQWPLHMRETISDITKIPKKQIVIHRQPFYAPHDEMLLQPSILAAIAALACVKGGYPVEIQDSTPVYRPAMHIERKSFFLPDGKPLAEEVHATVDQGAYSLFSGEMANQMFAGFVPACDLKAARLSVTFKESEQAPANFFGDLGYSEALATTEEQYNQVALQCGLNPDVWRIQFASAAGVHDELIHTSHATDLKTALTELCERSDFSRKFNAYQMMGIRNKRGTLPNRYSPFFGYSRGIALASGVGIAGFSNSERRAVSPLQVQLQLDPGDKVTINTSFYGTGNSGMLWRQIISEKLGIPENSIECTQDGQDMVDSGPSVLSSNSGRMPLLVARACDLIREKRFVNPLPLVENVTDSHEGHELFSSTGWASMVLEVVVDTVTFIPKVRNVWVEVLVGRLFDEQAYREKIRHTVVATLRENGATLADGKELTIEVLAKQVDDGITSSVTSAVKALVLSTFAASLAQALGTKSVTLPITSSTIMEAMTQRRTK